MTTAERLGKCQAQCDAVLGFSIIRDVLFGQVGVVLFNHGPEDSWQFLSTVQKRLDLVSPTVTAATTVQRQQGLLGSCWR